MHYLKLFPTLASLSLALDFAKPIPTTVLPIPSLPTLFPPPIAVDPISTESIRKTLALYPLAIDGKDFDALSLIFTEDVVANYSAPLGILTPLSNIQETLSASLACVSTQHSFGTQLIDVVSPFEATSITYYQASHFGLREGFTGEVATAYGQYQDFWRRQGDGTWKVASRNLVYMSEVIGNQSVFVC
ncbi:hypothetical protein BDV12DRAFT_172267 [Aspergillus spectabilis]